MNCRDDILMVCNRCGNRVPTPRVAHDPIDAIRCHTNYCDLCEEHNDHFMDEEYYDKDGRVVEWWNSI